MALIGSSETARRSLSLLASGLTLPLVYLLATGLLHQRRHGLLAMLIFVLLLIQIGFAEEARSYALLLIPPCGASLAIAHMLLHAHRTILRAVCDSVSPPHQLSRSAPKPVQGDKAVRLRVTRETLALIRDIWLAYE